jgi:PAS domain S-box-containing protein
MPTSSIDFFQLSPMPMWVADVNTSAFLEVNAAATSFYGYERAEFLQMKVSDIEGNQVLTLLNKEIRTHFKKDGFKVHVHVVYNQLKFQGKQAALYLVNDFTESIESEKKMRESVERFNIVSKATSDTIWDYNLKTETIFWNRGIKGIFGHKDVVNHTTTSEWWFKRIHPDDRRRVWKGFQKHLVNKIPRWQDEYRFGCGDGSYRYVLDRGFMVFDEQGTPVRVIGAIEDVTKRKEYIQAIEEQNKRFKEIAWIQSHMVRAPLARILALVDLIKTDQPDVDNEMMLNYLSSSAKELNTVIINIADKSPIV